MVAAIGGTLVARRRREAPSPPSRTPEIPAPTATPEPAVERAELEAAIPRTVGMAARIRNMFARGATDVTWKELEEALIRADVGAKASADVVARVREAYRPPADPAEVVMGEVAEVFAGDPSWRAPEGDPAVIMVVGV